MFVQIKNKSKQVKYYLWTKSNHIIPELTTGEYLANPHNPHRLNEFFKKMKKAKSIEPRQPITLDVWDTPLLYDSLGVVAFTMLMVISGSLPGGLVYKKNDYGALLESIHEKIEAARMICSAQPDEWKELRSRIAKAVSKELAFNPRKPNYEFNFFEQPLQKWRYLLELRA